MGWGELVFPQWANSQVWRASGASSQWGESYICTEDTLILYKPLVDTDSKIRCSFFPEIFISGFFFLTHRFNQTFLSVCLFFGWFVEVDGILSPESSIFSAPPTLDYLEKH